jgi:putative serine protease PepD
MSIAGAPRRHPTVPATAWLAGAALLGVVALAVVLLALGAFGSRTHTTVIQRTASGAPGFDPAALYASANPGVVDITARTVTTAASGPFGAPRKTQAIASGTGVVLGRHGDVLTADHVVAGSRSITVTFQGGATRSAMVLGRDAGTDVAVLHVDPSGLALAPPPLGTLSGHRVGDPVAVIGDPFDVQRSLSTGVISGLDRTIQAPNGYEIPHAVQTDAAINPGNSGGPILDAGGRVIGIADQIATGGSGDSSTGVGFAVPIDVVKGELAQLEASRTPSHAYVGVAAGDARDAHGDVGALVQSVQPGGPAARAGVRKGDLIVALGSRRIAGVNDLVAGLAALEPGTRTTLAVMRQGRRGSLAVTLAAQPTRATQD